MSIVSAVILGIIQGLTEFLPVSSSGHLALAHHLFPALAPAEALTFDVLLHLATLAAVMLVYARDIAALLPAAFRLIGKLCRHRFSFSALDAEERMVLCLLLATLPMALALPFDTAIEALASHTKAVGLLLMANGLFLGLTDRFAAQRNEALTPTRALTVGFCQLCAILPGLSRSGATVSGGRLCGFSREEAVRFSFLLSIPAILGANLMRLPTLVTEPPFRPTVLPILPACWPPLSPVFSP